MSLNNIPVPDNDIDRLLIDMKFRRLLPYIRGDVLDVGCGVGIMTEKIFGAGFVVEGVDGSQKRISEAMKRVPDVKFYTALFQDFRPYKKYDSVVLSSVLEHLTDVEGDDLLKRCWGWLKPKGTLLAAVPNRNALHKKLNGVVGLTEADHLVGHKRVYDFVELCQQISKAGFKVTDMGGVVIKTDSNNVLSTFPHEYLEKWFKISNLNDTFHLASVVYVVAKK